VEVGAGVAGEAVLAVAEECRAGEAPAAHGNDSQATAAID
jgi:hypothetical protein